MQPGRGIGINSAGKQDAGAIGRPVFAEATCHDWFYPADGFRDWLIDPALAGGGALYDVGSHRIDLMNYLFGQPMRVSGHLSTLIHPIQVDDNATVMIEHASGVRSLVDARRHSRVAREEFRIRGTDGEPDGRMYFRKIRLTESGRAQAFEPFRIGYF